MPMLPHDQRVFLQVGNVIEGRLWPEFKQQPADVSVEKTFADVVRVFIVIDMFMMAAMVACPHQDRILERSRAEDEREQTHRQFRPKSHVREQTVITERDAEARRDQQHREQGEMEPIKTEIPQVKRHCGERENKCADQERTRRPINAAGRNAEDQEGSLGRITSSLYRPSENNVRLCPGMNAAAVRTGELLCFHSGRPPAFLFYCPSGIGQL